MLLARVIGNVVATQKNQRYEGTRVMLCRQITPEGDDMDYTCIALDSVNSGEGDIVVIAQQYEITIDRDTVRCKVLG